MEVEHEPYAFGQKEYEQPPAISRLRGHQARGVVINLESPESVLNALPLPIALECLFCRSADIGANAEISGRPTGLRVLCVVPMPGRLLTRSLGLPQELAILLVQLGIDLLPLVLGGNDFVDLIGQSSRLLDLQNRIAVEVHKDARLDRAGSFGKLLFLNFQLVG